MLHNKTICKIKDIPKTAENFLLADEDCKDIELKHYKLRRCLLIRMRIRNASVSNTVFKHCVFEDCYLKDGTFRSTDFTGSFFKECDLRKTTFESCIFWYVRFYRCYLDYDAILQNIPTETNISMDLLRYLRQNALDMGEKIIADKILKEEINVEKKELLNRYRAQTDYYKERYSNLGKFKSLIKFCLMSLSGFFLGHGMRLKNIIISALICIFIFALLIYKIGSFSFAKDLAQTTDLNFIQALYLSTITFTTLGYGDIIPVTSFSYIICAVESFLGIVFLGFLAVTVYRKFSR